MGDGGTLTDNVSLVHMNGRVYDPVIGRFLSPDRVVEQAGNSQSLNPYSYVQNRVLTLTDPTGLVTDSGKPRDGGSNYGPVLAYMISTHPRLAASIGFGAASEIIGPPSMGSVEGITANDITLASMAPVVFEGGGRSVSGSIVVEEGGGGSGGESGGRRTRRYVR